MVDYAKLQKWGKPGCFFQFDSAGNPVFSQTNSVSFRPLSLDKIDAAKNRIAQLQGTIEKKAGEVDRFGRDAIRKFSEYLETPIEVCLAPGFVSSAGGTIASFFSPQQTSVGAGAYQACLSKRQKLQLSIDEANINFINMSNTRLDLYADYQELLQFAPSQEAWTQLCSKKLVAENNFNALSREVQAVAKKAKEKLEIETKAQAAETSKIDLLISLLSAFIEAIKQMVAAISAIFQEIIKGVAVATKFLAKYPNAIWIGGVTISLGILAFIIRPYVAAASQVTRVLSGKHRKYLK